MPFRQDVVTEQHSTILSHRQVVRTLIHRYLIKCADDRTLVIDHYREPKHTYLLIVIDATT